MNRELIEKTKQFVKDSFTKHPHYSFNDWSVMYNHSVLTQEISLKIAQEVDCDKTLVSIGALLHDIGKTYEADPETLHKRHEEFNLLVSEEFLKSLNLQEEQLERLKEIVSYQDDSTEIKVIKDADALAFYADKKLYMLFIGWARQNNLEDSTQRKIDKFSKLNFEASKEIGEDWFKQMKKDWGIRST